ncbi:YaiO family outer membrane beta-barrel protein [Candidatus Neomarinimicrobiota bacterium]
MTPIIIALFPLLLAQHEVGLDSTTSVLPDIYSNFSSGDSLSYEELFTLAQQLAHSDFHDQAIEVYTALIAANPADPDALLGRGLVYAWQGRFEEAVLDLSSVTEQYPAYGEAWMALGNTYTWWDQPENAQRAYTEWITVSGDIPEPYLARARSYIALRQFSRAREDLKAARILSDDRSPIDRLMNEINRTPGARPWEPLLLWEHLSFTQGRSPWSTALVSVKREVAAGALSLGLSRTLRFEEVDYAVLTDNYFDLWTRAYANIQLQIAPRHVVLPVIDLTGEVFQGFGSAWEMSGSYRWMKFPDKNVHILGGSLAYYAGDWYLRSKTQVAPSRDGINFFTLAAARRYLGKVDDFVDLAAGAGKEVETGQGTPLFFSSYVITVRAQYFFHPQAGLSLGGSFQETTDYRRTGLTLGLITRW